MFVYLALEICAILIPLIYSYDRKLQFYLKIKAVAISLLFIGSFYIAGDIIFTKYGIWGFNPKYHCGILLMNLPVEEWLFFIVIPYASLFLHDTLIYLFPQAKLSNRQTNIVSAFLIIGLGFLVITNLHKAYTSTYLTVSIFAIILAFFISPQILSRFYLTFMGILAPFFLLNSVLTGSFIDEPVVWYNNLENLGIRIFTVPVEDVGYAFSLILFNLLMVSKLEAFYEKKPVKGNSV